MRFISPPIILFIMQGGQRWVRHWVQGEKREGERDLQPCDLMTFCLDQDSIRPLNQAPHIGPLNYFWWRTSHPSRFHSIDWHHVSSDSAKLQHLIRQTIITNGLQQRIFINVFQKKLPVFHFRWNCLQQHRSRRAQAPETEDEDSFDLLLLPFTSCLCSAWIVEKKNSSGKKLI